QVDGLPSKEGGQIAVLELGQVIDGNQIALQFDLLRGLALVPALAVAILVEGSVWVVKDVPEAESLQESLNLVVNEGLARCRDGPIVDPVLGKAKAVLVGAQVVIDVSVGLTAPAIPVVLLEVGFAVGVVSEARRALQPGLPFRLPVLGLVNDPV